jgi:mono/diheme cytochrome c family protein
MWAALALSALLSLAGERVPLGAAVGDLRFTDTRYLRRALSELGPCKAYVLVFTTTDCPLVARYLPRLAAMEARYRPLGARFVAVDVGRGDSLVEVAAQAVDSGCAFPFVKDFDGELVEALGVERTPETVVLDGSRKLVYRGRIDSQHRLGGTSPSAGREDLARAIDDVLAGRAVEVAETPVDGCAIEDLGPPRVERELTWTGGVGEIVGRACAQCHRPDSVAPFALLAHRDAADHAETIAEVVRQGRMPPWYANPAHGSFVNAPRIDDDERDALVAWALAGAPKGEGELLLEVPAEAAGWRIGEPDLVVEQGLASELPADGFVPYRYVVLPTIFAHETWVEAVEIRSDNPRVVHHANLAHVRLVERFRADDFITGHVPGGDPLVCDPGTAVRIPAGSLLGLQVHFVTTGRPESAKLSVGLRFPRARVERELRHFQIHSRRFEIPPGEPAHRVAARRTFERDATGVGMFAHMHLRGRDMTFAATDPDGEREVLLQLPNYSFDWQQSYRWRPGERKFRAGTRVDVVAHFDNSAFNPYNPDPSATVRPGEQTFEEMMYGFLFFTEDGERLALDIDPTTGRAR